MADLLECDYPFPGWAANHGLTERKAMIDRKTGV